MNNLQIHKNAVLDDNKDYGEPADPQTTAS